MKARLKWFAVVLLLIDSACSKPEAGKPADVDYYTCTMHPSVHAGMPGKCPICGMDLVPVMKRGAVKDASNATSSPPGITSGKEFVVPVERQQQIGVTYTVVKRGPLHHTIRAIGTVEPDLQRRWSFVARVDGYVQQLLVSSPGQVVEKAAPLMSIYSPDLLTTSRELVMLMRMRDAARTNEARSTPERLISAAESRLRQWNITDEQIAELEQKREPEESLTLRSPFRGVVQEV